MRAAISAIATLIALALTALGCGSVRGTTATSSGPTTPAGTSVRVTAQVWADNWYSLYVNGHKVAEDSEPLTTVRSFNADTVTFIATYPLTIAVVTKDYTDGNSGLEYIGTPQQQMGDGGFIAQFTETATGTLIAATNDQWQALVIQRAPLNKACVTSPDPNTTCTYDVVVEPDGWTGAGFDASNWPRATVYSAAQVGPKGGYDTIAWAPAAKLVWTSDLFIDNTILWRYDVLSPT